MKVIRIFLWVTAIVVSIGAIDMLATYDFDVYTAWNVAAYWLAVYYMETTKAIEN